MKKLLLLSLSLLSSGIVFASQTDRIINGVIGNLQDQPKLDLNNIESNLRQFITVCDDQKIKIKTGFVELGVESIFQDFAKTNTVDTSGKHNKKKPIDIQDKANRLALIITKIDEIAIEDVSKFYIQRDIALAGVLYYNILLQNTLKKKDNKFRSVQSQDTNWAEFKNNYDTWLTNKEEKFVFPEVLNEKKYNEIKTFVDEVNSFVEKVKNIYKKEKYCTEKIQNFTQDDFEYGEDFDDESSDEFSFNSHNKIDEPVKIRDLFFNSDCLKKLIKKFKDLAIKDADIDSFKDDVIKIGKLLLNDFTNNDEIQQNNYLDDKFNDIFEEFLKEDVISESDFDSVIKKINSIKVENINTFSKTDLKKTKKQLIELLNEIKNTIICNSEEQQSLLQKLKKYKNYIIPSLALTGICVSVLTYYWFGKTIPVSNVE